MRGVGWAKTRWFGKGEEVEATDLDKRISYSIAGGTQKRRVVDAHFAESGYRSTCLFVSGIEEVGMVASMWGTR